jgi:uncharacterized protein YjlB
LARKSNEPFYNFNSWPGMIIQKYLLKEDEFMPNNPDLPVLVFRAVAADRPDTAGFFEQTFYKNGWAGIWRDGIYDYNHFHSNAHEVLGIAEGHVSLRLGGDSGILIHLMKGDCVVLPAGTGHKRVDATKDLLVVGAYPMGQENYDIRRSWQNSLGIREDIRHVAIPPLSPLDGVAGEADDFWQDRSLTDFLDIFAHSMSYNSLQSGSGPR